MIRVVVRHAPNMYAIIALCEENECPQEIKLDERPGAPTYYRVTSTDRWVLYHAAVSGHVEYHPSGNWLNPEQR